jgi:hypothetical protein
MLKGFDKKGRRVFVWRTGNIDPGKHKIDDVYRLHFLLMEILMDQCDQDSVTGFISVSDSQGATMSHVSMFSNPAIMKKGTTVFQDAYPSRPKAMHMTHMPAIFETVLTMFKTFLNEKMKERFMVHAGDNFDKLVEAVGADVLPAEFGGTNGTIAEHVSKYLNVV